MASGSLWSGLNRVILVADRVVRDVVAHAGDSGNNGVGDLVVAWLPVHKIVRVLTVDVASDEVMFVAG